MTLIELLKHSFLLLFACGYCAAQTALLNDLTQNSAGQQRFNQGFQDSPGIEINSTLYLNLTTPEYGTELWKKNAAGQFSIVKDIVTGSGSSSPQQFFNLNGQLIFVAFTPSSGRELWTSDGTSSGTFLLKELVASASGINTIKSSAIIDNKLYLLESNRLIVTDGSSSGTSILASLSFSNNSNLISYNNQLYMTGPTANNGVELLRWNGNSLEMVKDISAGTISSNPYALRVSNGKIYFYANDNINGIEVWTSDGTDQGTNLLKDINPGAANALTSTEILSYANFITLNPNTTIFTANNGVNGIELWQTDGTNAGTSLISDFNLGATGSNPFQLTLLNNLLIYGCILNGIGFEVCSYDGTTINIFDVNQGAPSSQSIFKVIINNKLLLVPNIINGANADLAKELWSFDGLTAPTLIKNIYPATSGSIESSPEGFIKSGNGYYFYAQDPIAGRELFFTDGTTNGTSLVADFNNKTISSNPHNFVAFDSNLYFEGLPAATKSDDSTGSFSVSWFANQTLSTINQVSNISYVSNFSDLPLVIADKLMLSAAISTNQLGVGNFGLEPSYIAQGNVTASLTQDIASNSSSNPATFARLNSKFLYSAIQNSTYGVFSFDGTTNQNIASNLNSVNEIYSRPNASFTLFSATDALGSELWITDGSVAGTNLLKDINVGVGGSNPSNFTELNNGQIIFSAASIGSKQLWSSDGTALGTTMIHSSGPNGKIISLGNKVIYSGDCGQLWSSDGTNAGTALIIDLDNSVCSAQIQNLMLFNGLVYFTFSDSSHGDELWVTDGTVAGTKLFKDINLGALSSTPQNLKIANSLLFFSADDGFSGHEPWRTDGTPAGTFKILDIWAGPNSSNPSGFTAVNNLIYFAADDAQHGREIWYTDGARVDLCPNDNIKFEAGICGCGVVEDLADNDNDAILNCFDRCPNDNKKTQAGICGCGIADLDSDNDGIKDCLDLCPQDINKSTPGVCGCGVPNSDLNANTVVDCLETTNFKPPPAKLNYRKGTLKISLIKGIKNPKFSVTVKLNRKPLTKIESKKGIVSLKILKKGNYSVRYKVAHNGISKKQAKLSDEAKIKINKIFP